MASLLLGKMEEAFGARHAESAWVRKDAYEDAEFSQVPFIQKFGAAMVAQTASPDELLTMLTQLAALQATHGIAVTVRRSLRLCRHR